MIIRTLTLPEHSAPQCPQWGIEGEHMATRLVLDLRSYLSAWPAAQASCAFRRADGTQYAHACSMAHGFLTLDLTDADTAQSGVCALTVSLTQDASIAKTLTFSGHIAESIHSLDAPPSAPEQGVIEQVNAAMQRAEAAAKAAEDAIQSGGGSIAVNAAYYTPVIDEATGTLSWQGSDDSLPEVSSANIRGPKGDVGPAGPTGPAGADGYTPVKGTDYFTPADQAGIVSQVLSALPAAEGVSY